jgi:peptide/nickel transport system substrate-binding protein
MGLAETLFRLGRQFEVEPWLAAAANQLDENVWEITLRQDVEFHNGAAVDAQAIKASLERAMTLDKGVAALLDILSIEVVDPLTLKIETNGPSPIMPGLLTEPKTSIVDAAAAVTLGDAFDERPVLTGPYKVEKFQKNKELVGLRHEGYWGAGPAVDRVEFVYLPDNSSRVLALQGGDIDIASYIAPPSVQVVTGREDLVVRTTVARATLVFMHLNQHKEAWQDAGVRRALSLAIDRNALVDAVLEGQAIPAAGPFPPSFLTCDTVQAHPFDPAEAKELLAAAGYKDSDGDGIVEKDGQPLTMKLLVYRQRSELPPLAEAIQSMLKKIGVEVDIQMVERISTSLREDDWDGGMYFNNMVATGYPYGTLFKFFAAAGSNNFGGYNSPKMEEIMTQLAQVADREGRRSLACDASQTIVDDVAVVPLLYPNFNYGASASVVGFEEPYPYHAYIMDAGIGKR